MTTLLFANHKGGVGKTTSVVALAREFARRGIRTLVVDSTDGHATFLLHAGLLEPLLLREKRRRAGDWRRPIRMPLPAFDTYHGTMEVVCTNGRYLAHLREAGVRETELDWPDLARRYHVVLVDTPSHEDPFRSPHPLYQELTQDAAVIIPARADALSVGGTRLTLDYLREAARDRRRPPRLCGMFITMDRSDEVANTAARALSELATGSLFLARIPYNQSFARVVDSGFLSQGGAEMARVMNYEALATEMIGALGLISPAPGRTAAAVGQDVGY